jgi:hypothetical protein
VPYGDLAHDIVDLFEAVATLAKDLQRQVAQLQAANNILTEEISDLQDEFVLYSSVITINPDGGEGLDTEPLSFSRKRSTLAAKRQVPVQGCPTVTVKANVSVGLYLL